MDEMDLASKSPAPLKYPTSPSYEVDQYDFNAATGMVIRGVHVYEDYAINGMFADFGPESPKFSALEFRKTNAFAYENAKSEEAKWVKCQKTWRMKKKKKSRLFRIISFCGVKFVCYIF